MTSNLATETPSPATLKAHYEALVSRREPFLCRAQEASKFTIPGLIPDDGHTGHDELPTPFQSVGSRGVNNLASKLLLGLFPPNTPFFRLRPDPFKAKEALQDETVLAEIDESLSRIEQAVMIEVETQALRVQAFEALKHLVVAGNGLVYLPEDGGMRLYPLQNYVVKRDPMGHVLTIIVKETIAWAALPEEARAAIMVAGEAKQGRKVYDLYTGVHRVADGTFELFQEVEGTVVADSFKPGVKAEDVPFLALRMQAISGEDYGRGIVEDYMGDLMSLEGLSQAIVEGAAAAARLLFLVAPNGTTSVRELNGTPNGGFATGDANDITSLQAGKAADMQFARAAAAAIEQRLEFAFLLNTAIQRNGERVTAEEIRFMAQELEDALGGVLSSLSQSFQLPLVRRLMAMMERKGSLPKLPKDLVKPTIVTGIEALGRGHDLQRLQVFLSTAQQNLGPDALRYVNVPNLLSRLAAAASVDISGLIKTEEQLAQEAQQAQMAQMGQALAPQLANAAGPAIQQAVSDAAAQAQQ